MRNAVLHRALENFVMEASALLSARLAAGEEMGFELCEEGGHGGAQLYCYRPLTARFIRERRAPLATLPAHLPAARLLAECDTLELYLAAHGEVRVPGDRLGRATVALELFLCAIYAERSEFGFEPAHFEAAYGELEHTIYPERDAVTVIAPVLGIALDHGTTELTLGDGVSLIRGDALAGAPAEAVWAPGAEEPAVLAVLVVHDESRGGAIGLARTRFRRLLSALRLFERGTYALGPLAWTRASGGRWRMVPTGASGRLGGLRQLTIVPSAQEEELRAFWRLVGRRGGAAGGGELAWALARFEMGCERAAPLEALTDHLLALRALLEPEGPQSGRLAQRLAVICAQPDERAALARRVARAIDLERAVITGMTAGTGLDGGFPAGRARLAGERGDSVEALVEELSAHLRAMLRDALCGHLDADLRAVADELLAEAAEEVAR
ncbi:MAG TPA: hypothetical protein VKV21_15605 [Solirubrobacteraceae bacterium]|nr:hypothetical protein [Solirubrobacteraceae bacterium]